MDEALASEAISAAEGVLAEARSEWAKSLSQDYLSEVDAALGMLKVSTTIMEDVVPLLNGALDFFDIVRARLGQLEKAEAYEGKDADVTALRRALLFALEDVREFTMRLLGATSVVRYNIGRLVIARSPSPPRLR